MRTRQRLELALVLVLAGCNSRFAFDDHPLREDGGEGDVAPGPFEGSDVQFDLGRGLSDASGGDLIAAGPVICGEQVPSCLCSGTICACARQQWCRLPTEACPGNGPCTFLCHNATRCEGACGDGCKVECEHGSTCAMTMADGAVVEGESSELTVTVGANSKVHCENNATCHITCTGPCTLECQSGARCDLRCAGDRAPRSADFGGSCHQ